MPNNNPGYIGYQVTSNEVLQTGVHCGDIAMHIESLRAVPEIQAAITFLESGNNSTLLYSEDPAEDIMKAQSILVNALQQKRRELCAFAIEQINLGNESGLMCCEFLGPEIQEAIAIGEITFHNLLSNSEDIEDFCRRQDVCISYIKQYYLKNNQIGDDATTAEMFIIPDPGKTGMMDIVAMQLKRKIIVLSARNGDPYESYDFSESDEAPIYVGYDGLGHFVELIPLEVEQLLEISDLQLGILERLLIENLSAIGLAKFSNDISENQLTDAKRLLAQAKKLYSTTESKSKSLEQDSLVFISLLTEPPKSKRPETQNKKLLDQWLSKEEAIDLYTTLLNAQIDWLKCNAARTISSTEKTNQIQVLVAQINTKLNHNTKYNSERLKKITDIIERQAARTIGIENDFVAAQEKSLAIKKIFIDAQAATATALAAGLALQPTYLIADKPITPADIMQPIANDAPKSKASLFDQFKAFISNMVETILYPLKWLFNLFAAPATKTPVEVTIQTKQNSAEINYDSFLKIPSSNDPGIKATLPLAEKLKTHFIRKLKTVKSSIEKENLLSTWNEIITPLRSGNCLQFCNYVEEYMQKHAPASPYIEQRSAAILLISDYHKNKTDKETVIKHKVKEISFKYDF